MLKTSNPEGDLILATWVPDEPGAARFQAERAWTDILNRLDSLGAVPLDERAFGSLGAAPCLLGARRAVAQKRGEALRVEPTYVEGLPADESLGSLAGIHVVAGRAVNGGGRWLTPEGHACGRVVESPNAHLLSLCDVGVLAPRRATLDPAEETRMTLQAAETALSDVGWSFGEVCRTWFYLRDILDWYDGFNCARNEAFRRMGLMAPGFDDAIPASTGIGGRSARGGACALDLLAIRPKDTARFERQRLRNVRQNEATAYGSAFARGVCLDLGPMRYVFVSGTAAIDEQGVSVHAGDFRAQVVCTLENVAALLEGAGAGLADVEQATAFVKRPADAETFRHLAQASGLSEVPAVTTIADVCRDELLFELDAAAVLPAPGHSAEPCRS
jgi:enamine deaminase RidA (YjgF/YER057c/UK114 family)